jgi:tripartite-type tricarboxylate transporter receptor subunit TctC
MWGVRFIAVLALLAGPVNGTRAATPQFPDKPIRYVVATGPGGASDLVARVIGPPLSELLGVQLVIDNRTGAGNTVGRGDRGARGAGRATRSSPATSRRSQSAPRFTKTWATTPGATSRRSA